MLLCAYASQENMEELHFILGAEDTKVCNNPVTGILYALKVGDLNDHKKIAICKEILCRSVS